MNSTYAEWGPARTRTARADAAADSTRPYDSMPAPEAGEERHLVSVGSETGEPAPVPSTVLPEDN